MANRLDPIIAQKGIEVAKLKNFLCAHPEHPIEKILRGEIKRNSNKSFKQALRKKELAVIAEVKRKSPSKGELAVIADPLALVQQYVEGGADAISVLTDKPFFNGSLEDLKNVADFLASPPDALSSPCKRGSIDSRFRGNDSSLTVNINRQIPVLRKDFTLDAVQIAEAIVNGADAVLLMVCVLGKKIEKLLQYTRDFNIDAIVEVHDLKELKIAIDCGAEIIGVNNRDFSDLSVHPECALELISDIPKSAVKISESGILTPENAQRYFRAGYDAVLIGEALVKSADPKTFINNAKYKEPRA